MLSFNFQNIPTTEADNVILSKVMLYFVQNKDNLMETFLNDNLPGLQHGDPIEQAVPLASSRDPLSVIISLAMKSMNDGCLDQFKMLANQCDQGFVMDNSTGWCLAGLRQPFNFWEASEQCSSFGADLIEFDNDVQVQGLIELLKSGKFLNYYFEIVQIC